MHHNHSFSYLIIIFLYRLILSNLNVHPLIEPHFSAHTSFETYTHIRYYLIHMIFYILKNT
jgi:hypothetical protein